MGNVFKNVVREGDLGGFGLENIGNVSKLNGTVRLAESFTPSDMINSTRQRESEQGFDDEDQLDEEQIRDQARQFREQTRKNNNPEPPKFFGDEANKGTPQFFGEIKQSSKGIPNPNEVSFFGQPSKVPEFFGNVKNIRKKPLIGQLNDGVDAFDKSFTYGNAKPPLKRGTGFDNFVGDIDVNALANLEPDSAVPKSGVFADKRKGVDTHRNFIENQSGDLGGFTQQRSVLPTGSGFGNNNIDINDSVQSFNEIPSGRKAGRPVGSVGKKKRQARKLAKAKSTTIVKPVTVKPKKKKRNELSKARLSLLEEQARLNDGGAPRNALQARSFNTNDNSFRGLFT